MESQNQTLPNCSKNSSPTKPPMVPSGPGSKVGLVLHAGTVQRVEEVDIATPTIPTTLLTPISPGQSKVGIKAEHGQAGRPRNPVQCNLPPGYRSLRYGISQYTQEVGNKLVDAYYANAGSLTRACRDSGVRYGSALAWRDSIPEFGQALQEVDEIIKDEVHSQFMERVLTTQESNPTWKLTYFKKHFPQYSEVKKSAKIVFSIKDTLIKPDIVEGEVIPPKQLESSDESGPTKAVDSPAHAGKVS